MTAKPMRRLGELVIQRREKVSGKKEPSRPYVGLEHLATDRPDLLGTAPAASSVSTNAVFSRGNILFGKLRPNLRKSILAPCDGYCSTDIIVLEAAPDVEPGFAARVCQSEPIFREAVATAVGTKMPRTSWRVLRDLNVFTPEAREQRRIAEVLDTLDAAIRETERVVAKLRQMKQGLLHDLLTRGLDANGELRDPDRHPEQFKDSPLGRIPREWDVERLGGLVDRSGGLIQTGPFGSQLHAREYVEEGIPVVMPQDMIDGRLVEDEVARITSRRAGDLRRHWLQENDVVISRRGDLSRCASIGARETGWICGTGCMLVRVAPSELDGPWLSAVFRHHIGQRQIMSKAVGSTMVNLNRGILADLRVPNPPYEERKALTREMDAMEERLDQEVTLLPKLRLLKQGLMDDLLTGRVRVPVGEEAGAHV